MEENTNLKEKVKLKIAISKYKEENKNANKSSKFLDISKKLGIAACFIFALTGVGFATQNVIEKIWKEPESFTVNEVITEEEKENVISEEQARELAEEFMKEFGLDKQITALTLRKDITEDEIFWNASFNDGMMIINGQGKFTYINIPTWKYTIPYDYGITREEARFTAREVLEKYNPNDDSDEYVLISLKRNASPDEEAYIWYAEFVKKYDDLLNKYESINIGWVPTINGLYNLGFKTSNYENNKQVISKEDAIKVAVEKDKQIETEKTIKSTKAEIRIEQMNADVYYRENNKEEYESGRLNLEKVGENSYRLKEDAVFYKTENRVRKVWEVVVEYDVEKSLSSFTYYVDATTGEIIGGKKWDGLITEEQLYNDPGNVIEK